MPPTAKRTFAGEPRKSNVATHAVAEADGAAPESATHCVPFHAR